jgi:hypothetical protein
VPFEELSVLVPKWGTPGRAQDRPIILKERQLCQSSWWVDVMHDGLRRTAQGQKPRQSAAAPHPTHQSLPWQLAQNEVTLPIPTNLGFQHFGSLPPCMF